MPRIRQYSATYDEEDFRKDLFRRLADRYGEVSIRKLADEAGVSQATLNSKIRHSAKNLDVLEFRLIVPIIQPDPGILLKLLGYTPQQIKRFKES